MKQTDFETMDLKALKKYILEHRNDQIAWEFFMNRINAEPPTQIYDEVSTEEFAKLVRKHQKS
jgi:hypothetical protein